MIGLFHRFLSTWFGFNKQQRNGLLVLCVLMLILFGIRLSLHQLIQPDSILIADFSHIKFPEDNSSNSTLSDSSTKKSKPSLFVFDPNTASQDQLVKLGFKEKTAHTLINYRNKGGKFREKEDLKKVYGVSEGLYRKLEPFILIKGKESKSDPSENKITEDREPVKTAKTKSVLELNSCDSLALLELPGIGPGFTKRILKYRSLLGGFYSVDQLKEVYGFKDSTFTLIKDLVKTDATLIKKIDLNTDDFKGLNKHPYLNYDEVKAIFYFRKKNGSITSLDILRQAVPNEETLKKLGPYLDF